MRLTAAIRVLVAMSPPVTLSAACTLPTTGMSDRSVTSAASSGGQSAGGSSSAGAGASGGSGGSATTGGQGSGGDPERVYVSCGAIAPGSPSGVYALDPDGAGAEPAFDTYCDLVTRPGWALVYSSVANSGALRFFQIPYADRFFVKGTPSPVSNFYAGAIYRHAIAYRDEAADATRVVELFEATTSGIDEVTMAFIDPTFVSGNVGVFTSQFAAGWASQDEDFDGNPSGNCSATFLGITQHYSSCFAYNLGADAETPLEDVGWGPHMESSAAASLGLATDGSGYTRVSRIARWASW